MGTTMTPSATERAEALIAAARPFRDGWIPVDGPRSSGFVSPKSVTVAGLEILITINLDEHIARTRADHSLESLDGTAVDVESAEYPARLQDLDGRPALLFVHGSLPDPSRTSVAIVGSRKATQAGIATATEIASALADIGSPVVSGLAEGIDSAAHAGALSAGGHTVAVMGTGLGRVFPAANESLAERISQHGALVTQFPPEFGPTKTTFPARNALIAGLSDISVLVEMTEHSGTRIEADCALTQGKMVVLWEPLLGDEPWAQKLADHPLVRFVRSSAEVVELAG
jgi:DNA processing protein